MRLYKFITYATLTSLNIVFIYVLYKKKRQLLLFLFNVTILMRNIRNIIYD